MKRKGNISMVLVLTFLFTILIISMVTRTATNTIFKNNHKENYQNMLDIQSIKEIILNDFESYIISNNFTMTRTCQDIDGLEVCSEYRLEPTSLNINVSSLPHLDLLDINLTLVNQSINKTVNDSNIYISQFEKTISNTENSLELIVDDFKYQLTFDYKYTLYNVSSSVFIKNVKFSNVKIIRLWN